MKISTEEFINLVKDRPALWQKLHPEFANRHVRNKLLDEVSRAAGMTSSECSKKLKNLKDTMRAQVAKLPKTESGFPAFNLSSMLSWPYFKHMIFMKDEFAGKKMMPSTESDEEVHADTAEYEEYEGYALTGTEVKQEPASNYQSCAWLTYSPVSTITDKPPHEHVSNESWPSSAGSPGQSTKRRHVPNSSDFEEKKMMPVKKFAWADEFEAFALDIANDLRKIKNPVKLIQTKAKIRRVVEEGVLSELLDSSSNSTTLPVGEAQTPL